MSVDQVRAEIQNGMSELETAPIDQLMACLGEVSLEGWRRTVEEMQLSLSAAGAGIAEALITAQYTYNLLGGSQASLLLALFGTESPEGQAALNAAALTGDQIENAGDIIVEMQRRCTSMSGVLDRFLSLLDEYEKARGEAIDSSRRGRALREDALYQAGVFSKNI